MDKDEFCIHIRECEKAMYSLAYSIVKNEHDACDVVSESILRAYRNIETLKNNRAFKSWILRIIHNTAVELIRKEHTTIDIGDVQDIEEKTNDVDTETRLVLKDAVNKLKQPYRTVVTLYYYENLPTAEIARIMNVTNLAVRQHLSRARKQLKELLEKEDYTI